MTLSQIAFSICRPTYDAKWNQALSLSSSLSPAQWAIFKSICAKNYHIAISR